MNFLGYYTDRGKELAVRLLTGTPLHYTRAAAGSGTTPLSADAMVQEQQALPIGRFRRTGMTVSLPVTLSETLVEEDFTLAEVGLYAQDENGEELLYRIYRLSEPMAITAGERLTVRFYLEETVSQTVSVTVESTGAGLLTEEDLIERSGVPGGLATLDGEGTVPVQQMPYTCGTEDLEAGVTPLQDGHLYFLYE